MIAFKIFIQRILAVIVLTSAAALSLPTFAYYEFTYTSQQLPFAYGSLNGFIDPELGSNDYPAWFSISFNSAGGLSPTAPTIFSMNNPIAVSSADPNGEMEIKPESNGYIVVNPDGTISSWELNVMTFIRPTDRFEEVTNTQIDLHSRGGTASCNCDEFVYRYTVAIQRPYDQWMPGSTLAFHNQGASAFSHWTITEKVSVPEPGSVILFILGLSLIGYFRRGKFSKLKGT